ncbi:unnamed protein product [Prorocentrum cordatum]|uniref:Uncharacterized protein n=1 Tax=Prorocentrum cordatum TaxID=2364126 RepID=A0ABN9WCM7_9DINO|nr:unnamed protein product [Polarella glacialis]
MAIEEPPSFAATLQGLTEHIAPRAHAYDQQSFNIRSVSLILYRKDQDAKMANLINQMEAQLQQRDQAMEAMRSQCEDQLRALGAAGAAQEPARLGSVDGGGVATDAENGMHIKLDHSAKQEMTKLMGAFSKNAQALLKAKDRGERLQQQANQLNNYTMPSGMPRFKFNWNNAEDDEVMRNEAKSLNVTIKARTTWRSAKEQLDMGYWGRMRTLDLDFNSEIQAWWHKHLGKYRVSEYFEANPSGSVGPTVLPFEAKSCLAAVKYQLYERFKIHAASGRGRRRISNFDPWLFYAIKWIKTSSFDIVPAGKRGGHCLIQDSDLRTFVDEDMSKQCYEEIGYVNKPLVLQAHESITKHVGGAFGDNRLTYEFRKRYRSENPSVAKLQFTMRHAEPRKRDDVWLVLPHHPLREKANACQLLNELWTRWGADRLRRDKHGCRALTGRAAAADGLEEALRHFTSKLRVGGPHRVMDVNLSRHMVSEVGRAPVVCVEQGAAESGCLSDLFFGEADAPNGEPSDADRAAFVSQGGVCGLRAVPLEASDSAGSGRRLLAVAFLGPLPSRVLHGLLRNRFMWLQSGTDYREDWAPSPPRSRARHGALTGAADSTRGIIDCARPWRAAQEQQAAASWCAGRRAPQARRRQAGRMAVSAGAKKAGTDALRAAGADVTDDDVASLVLKVRATLNAGRAPRSKLDEARRLEAALDPVAIRLALGNPEVPGSEMAEALWGFTEAATYATQAESRIRRVAADTDGWERIADWIWARAVGDDGGTLPTDWLLHLGIGLLLSSLVVVLGADSGRHRLAGAAVGLCGTVLLVRRVPERVVAWWARWRRRSAFAAALRSGGDGLDLTAAEDDCAAWDAKGAPTTKGGGAGATEVPTGPLHPPGLAALPPSPWAPPAEGVGGGAPPAKPGAQDLAALRAFGQGSEVPGPFSQTAALQQQQQQQPQPSPEVGVPTSGLSFHAPYAPADAVKLGREVQMVGATLREFQAQAATNVYWAWHFWERIAAVDGSMGLHPDLRRVLQTHGYVGAGTKSPPGGSLQQELDALLSSATAPHGGGMHASPGWAVAPVTQQQQEDSRWNLSLPPDLRRAAPEIYRTMRGAGAASARDWLSQEVTGQRHTAVWTDLWTRSELLTRLASDDALELHLRRLASYVYEMRTKDKVGAAAMLAVRPPGSAADLAPTWLVTEATTHSKAEHQRDERVHAASKHDNRGAPRPRVQPRMPVTGLPGSLTRALQWKEAEARALLGVGARLGAHAGAAEPAEGGASGAPRASPPEGGGLEADDLGDAGPEDAQQHRYDDDWLGQQSSCRAAPPSPSGYSVAEWLEAVRRAKRTAEGKLADGTFRTSPLAQYPEGMCEALGALIVQTLAIFEQTGLGGTGWRRPPEADRSVTAWSSRSTTAPAVAVRNEDVLRGRGLVLDGPQMAFYLHVDDGVAMAGGSGCGPRATEKMHHLADALAEAGFVVTDRTEASDMQKVLGYAPQARPAQLRLPPKRARELVRQLEEMGATRTLHTEELRSLLGVWIWGALLRRELLCIPSAVFRLLERHPHQRVCTWATVRRELRAMAQVVPLMYADLGAPPAPVYFAADAMGANVEDDGGWGILVTDMSEDIAKDFIDTGGSLGYTVARLDGELTGLRRPEQVIRRTKPFSLLPDRVFKPDEDWTIVGAGRWRTADHITLGEGRCVVKISRLAAATPALHRTVLPILEDNQPVSGAVCKGRKLDSTSVEKVKPHTLAAYRAAAMKFVTYLDEHGFVPDGPEQWGDLLVEYKNDMQMTKCNFEYAVAAVDIKEAGRWLTESSLRIYVDVVTASRVLAQAEQRGIAPLIREAAEKLPNYFPEGIFGEGQGIQHAASGLAKGPGRLLGAACGGSPSSAAGGGPPGGLASTPSALGALVDGLLAGPQQPGDAAAGAGAAEAEAPAPAAPGVGALGPPQPLVAQPLAAGAAAGSRRARWSKWSLLRAVWLIARWCGRSTSRGVTWAAVAAMLIGWRYMAGPLTHVGTMMGVVASVSVSAGKVVDSSLGAVITAAQGVSDFAVTSSRSSASLLQEAWRGVDITNLHVRQRHAERLADDPEILQDWIQREFLTGEPRPPGAEQVATAIAEASVTIPHMSERWQLMIWPSQYRELHMTLDLLPSGFYGVHMVERIVNFSVQWSNPVWSSLDCDISSERDTVVAHINSTLAGLPLPEIRYMSMTDREIQVARLPGAWINIARRFVRAVYMAVKSVLQLVLFGI